MINPAPTAPTGYLAAARSLGDGLLATVQERVEVFSIEVQEEKLRLLQTFIWLGALFFLSVMAMTFASLTLVYLWWNVHRGAVLGGLTILYSGGLLWAIISFRRFLAKQPPSFPLTQLAIKEDRACIRNGN